MNLVDRAKNILLQPKQEWQVIAAEPATVQGLYTQYVMILAAIPAVASFIGMSLVGFTGFGVSYRVPIGAGIAHMVVSYLLSLGMVYVLALIIDALAPSFGGEKNFIQSLKIAAFAPTASWLAGIFNILPALAILNLLGLYSLYLLYTGIPLLKKTPEDKAVPYTVVVIIAAIVLGVLIAALAGLAIPSQVRGF
jgi:hypothetical protein